MIRRSRSSRPPRSTRRGPRPQHRPRGAPRARQPLKLLTLFFAALAIRLLYVASVADAPFVQILQTNPQRYHVWASLILGGQAPQPPFDQAPGYPYLLASIYALAGASPQTAMVFQAFLDSVSCVFILLGAQRLFGASAGVIAGAMAALCSPLIYFTGEILPATSHLAALSGAVTASLYGYWWPAGMLWGAATALRLESLLGLPILGLYAWRKSHRRAAAAVTLPALTVLLALTIWSSVINAQPTPPLYGSGLNLWLGNNPHADGVSPFVSGRMVAIAERIKQLSQSQPLVADALFRRRAVQMWRDYPRESLALWWRKLRWTFTARELPNTSDIDWQHSYSWMYRNPVLPLSFGIVLISACTAAPLLRGRWWVLSPLLAGPLIALTVCLATFTNARFRLPMLPSLLILGGAGLDHLAILARRRAWRDTALPGALLAVVVGAWLAYSDPYGVWSYTVPQLDVNAGVAERQVGHFDVAVTYLRRALKSTPEDPIAWVHLALALEQSGDRHGAAEAYLEGLTRSGDSTDLRPMAQRFFDRHHVDPKLIERFQETDSSAIRAAIKQQILSKLRQ